MSKLNFGMRRAKLLCQMSVDERFDLIAEGLPIILESARGFWRAAESLKSSPRESEVLSGFAEEEAAKALILLDAVRCPPSLISSKMGQVVGIFYDHLARLTYAEAQSWKPMDVNQLRGYVDNQRKAHYLEGNMGEYILPNWNVARREGLLYADIEAYEDEKPSWNKPAGYRSMSPPMMPYALQTTEALSALGLFSRKGLTAVSETWGTLEFKSEESSTEARGLTRKMLERIVQEHLQSDAATSDHIGRIYNAWQMPMYNLEFKMTDVPLEELERERQALMWAEIGDY